MNASQGQVHCESSRYVTVLCSMVRSAFILAARDPWPGTPVASDLTDHEKKSEVMEIRWNANATVQDITILVAWLPVHPET